MVDGYTFRGSNPACCLFLPPFSMGSIEDKYRDVLIPLKWRILHSWSFHMKFMKRAFGEFHKFHMN